MSASTTVYVVDDDEDVRKALARLLTSAGWNVVAFDSPRAFLDGFDRATCSCLVLDLAMPGIGRSRPSAHARAEAQTLPIVFLTGHGDVTSSVQAMKHGATDFLQKPVDDEVLLAAIAHAMTKAKSLRAAERGASPPRRGHRALTPRERQVLEGIVAGRLNKQIAGDVGIAEKTVKYHRGNLMRKMQVRNVAELLKVAQRAGIGKTQGG